MSKPSHREVIGLIPAAGRATRLGPLPCSKELLPVGFQDVDKGQSLQLKPVGQYLLEHFRQAGAQRVYIVVRKGKWDILEYFGDGSSLNMSIGYLIMNQPHGVPYTIDQAFSFVKDATIVFGFPDILIDPQDACARLVAHLDLTQADVVLGLFPTDQPHLCDPIEFDNRGRIHKIHIKPAHSDLRTTWTVAAWSPSFTHFLHEYLAEVERVAGTGSGLRPELYISHVLMTAIESGLKVEGLHLPGARFLDIGVPENLIQALRNRLNFPR